MILPIRIAAFALTLLLPATAMAHGFQANDLEIVHPFVRATPPTAKVGAGYVVLRNSGTEPDRLVGMEIEVANNVTFHQTVTENDMAMMMPIEGGLEVPAGGEYRLGFDGSHAMLEGLTGPIVMGAVYKGTLIFEKAGRVDVTFEVEPAGVTQDEAMAGHDNAQ